MQKTYSSSVFFLIMLYLIYTIFHVESCIKLFQNTKEHITPFLKVSYTSYCSINISGLLLTLLNYFLFILLLISWMQLGTSNTYNCFCLRLYLFLILVIPENAFLSFYSFNKDVCLDCILIMKIAVISF